ncbi:superoxide dismutase [Pedosphaera parvula]|uniref:superoxide dismutase n=1 Tax=Pedosphaera parvula (strain Ellin514) TaxID=320771 RepID=B9XFP8_PEDPL|nr:superoxide dismutase [Pedosphaera parvula]EEF61412.1 Superoxide dismutase [Pedosphaera parvula Ellin514]
MITRRHALKTTAIATAACATILPALAADTNTPIAAVPTSTAPFTLPPLPYAFDALEPHIDAKTMEIHHDKHHGAYVTNLNKALAGHPDLEKKSLEELLNNPHALPETVRTAIQNNGGGHYNHSLFWQMLSKNGGGEPKGELARAIDKYFMNFTGFKDELTKSALGRFGSGWAWLVIGTDKHLSILSTANQDTPISLGLGAPGTTAGADALKGRYGTNLTHTPLLGIDVWEHAYYLKYQNRRPDYVAAFFNIINWDYVTDRYQKLAS